MSSNPYYEHALLTDPTMFYGRERDIRELCEWLSKKQCVSIVGQRRIGKSSLLYHLCQESTYSKYIENWKNFVFAYLDLREVSGTGSSGFFLNASEIIIRAIGNRISPTKTVVHNSPGFRDFIEDILAEGLIVVLCLDEFEGLVESLDNGINGEFLGFLRSLGNNHRLLIVTSSREPLYQICQTGDIAVSKFWNIFKQQYLGLIPLSEARRLIIEPAERNGVKFTDSDIEFILSSAGSYPFFIQRACFHLFQHYETHKPSALDYNAIKSGLYNEAFPFLEEIWKYLSKDEKVFLMGGVASIKEPQRGRIMDNLKNKGLLDERYILFSAIFEDFIKEKRSEKSSEKVTSSTSNSTSFVKEFKEPIEQLFSIQFGPEDILGLELRGINDFREQLSISQWNTKEIEVFRSRSRDIFESKNWRTSINTIGKELFSKLANSSKIVSVFSNAFPSRTERTRVVFRVPRELIALPLEWMAAYDIPAISDQIPLTVLCPVSKYITGMIRKHPPLPTNFVSDPNVRMLFIASNISGTISTSKGNLVLMPIDQAEGEISNIEELYKRGHMDGTVKCTAKFIHTGDCSAAELIKEMSSGYDWIHYAGHGWYDESNPDNSSLFLYTEKDSKKEITFLTASEMSAIAHDGEVKGMFLSGCTSASTASEVSLAYGDYLGIMHALVVANVPTIIGMRWPVPDKSMSILASEFYRALFAGMPIDYALYLAKRMVYKQMPSDPTWASPVLIHQLP